MNKSNKTLCLISAISVISFIVGVAVGPLAIGMFLELFFPNRLSQEKEAEAFFYRTMNAIFEDTYNPEEGSVSSQFMNEFKKYEPQLGKRCRLFIIDSSPGYYECFAFFPSGEVFSLAILRRRGGWILEGFHPRDWDFFWKDSVEDAKKLYRGN